MSMWNEMIQKMNAQKEGEDIILKTITKHRKPNDWIVRVSPKESDTTHIVGYWVKRGSKSEKSNGKRFRVKRYGSCFKVDIGTGSGFKVEFDMTRRSN